jgi:hypothetical protein
MAWKACWALGNGRSTGLALHRDRSANSEVSGHTAKLTCQHASLPGFSLKGSLKMPPARHPEMGA